jgi:hypothetical protein
MMARSTQLPAFRSHAERHGDKNGQDQGKRHQRERRLDTLCDQRGNRQIGKDRGAEIEVQDMPEPGPEPDQKRLVEPQTLANTLDVGGARLVARDHHRRITRRDVEQAEDEQRDDCHHWHGRKNAPQDIGQHVASPLRQADFDTPQKNGSGPFAIPLMFFRHAV